MIAARVILLGSHYPGLGSRADRPNRSGLPYAAASGGRRSRRVSAGVAGPHRKVSRVIGAAERSLGECERAEG
jgi:hypothetical protein